MKFTMNKIIVCSILAVNLSFTGCASHRIAHDVLANVKKVDHAYVSNAGTVQVSIESSINNREKIDLKVKDSLELALRNSQLFGDDTQHPYQIKANVLVASQSPMSFGSFPGKMGIQYTVLDDNGLEIYKETFNTVAGSDLSAFAPGISRHERSRARNIALNVNQFVESFTEVLKKK